ncbi:MAG: hypothetical protein A2070_03290 [Bdellovibrionales bacterium GWC1_52_8]|nr:MAG: hypothetical protein A2X97_02180 [Bdellovibrionales bacterium GWA1_52_35]OFZ33617.1 MAG: hypothetical protein A2070_03290 [Bdellovibrionales bacterium GWC1_52_8]HCM39251.1 hypothetical protein [Bdellovibrionales bacterium]
MQVSWSNGKEGSGKLADVERQLNSKDGLHYSCERPITLPQKVPGTLKLYLPVSNDWGGDMDEVTASLRYGSGTGQSVALDVGLSKHVGETNRGNTLGLDIRGLNRVLLENEESIAELTVEARTGGEKVYSYRLTLRTPPSKLEVKQKTRLEFLANGGKLPKSVEKLISVNVKLDLIQVVTVRNLSASSITAAIPIAPLGRLSTKFHQIAVNQGWCGYTTTKKDWDEELSSEFYMLPISSALSANFLEYLNERLLTGTFEITMEPGETRHIGLYSRGPGIEKLLSGGYVPQVLQPTKVVKDCVAVCGDRKTMMFHWKSPQVYWKDQGYPGFSRSCGEQRCDASQSYNRQKCNECAEWELQNGLSPWDDRRFCTSPAPGNPWGYPAREMWLVEKYFESIDSGIQTFPVVISFEPESTVVPVQFADDESTETARRVPVLKANSVQSE